MNDFIIQYRDFKEIEHQLLSTIPVKLFQSKNIDYHEYLHDKLKHVRNFCKEFSYINIQDKIIHIAGSGGKGTCAYLLSNILKDMGFNVGLFTSPHINTLLERIQYNNKLINIDKFNNIAKSIITDFKIYIEKHKISNSVPFSFFELIFLIAIKYFYEKELDFIILETGLGGKYDVTNIFDKPFMTILTSIHLDHTNILGNSLISIAENKIETIKNNVPVFVMYPQDKQVFKMIEKKANSSDLHYSNQKKLSNNIDDSIIRRYGINNIRLIDLIIDYIRKDKNINDKINIKNSINIPTRFEIIDENPNIILDAAHNPDKIDYMLSLLKNNYPNTKFNFLMSIVDTKDWKTILDKIITNCKQLFICNVKDYFRNTIPKDEILSYIKNKININYLHFYEDSTTAFYDMKMKTDKNDINIVTGSFLIVSEIRKLYYPEFYYIYKNINV